MAERAKGRLVVVSGPSGAGKSTLLERVLREADLPLVMSVSATTRPPRPGETDGVQYHFLSEEEFQEHRRHGDFLECFEVFGKGHWYGTLKSEVAPALEQGKWVVLEVDVKGAFAVRRSHPEAVLIFISPGSLEVLERRLRGRGTEEEAAVARRLAQAREEMRAAEQYDYQVINDDLERAVGEVCGILERLAQEAAGG